MLEKQKKSENNIIWDKHHRRHYAKNWQENSDKEDLSLCLKDLCFSRLGEKGCSNTHNKINLRK